MRPPSRLLLPYKQAGLKKAILSILVITACSACVIPHLSANQPAKNPQEARAPLRGKGYYPTPPYPDAARKAHIWGKGKVRTSFDAEGKVVSAVMIESTGNAMLDSNVTNFIKQHWRSPAGKPYSHDTAVVYGFFNHGRYYYTPDPPYGSPVKLSTGVGRTVKVRVTFEKTGNVSKVVVFKKSGSSHLDKVAADFIKDHWLSYLRVHETTAFEIQFSPDAPMQ